MKLKSLGVLNWANLENDNYHFGDVNMITGGSGTGKTTLLDAIQTILTGATSGLYQYNPGQEETTQRSRTKETRTLASYILGCDDGSYSRPYGSHGYIIANWAPEFGEKMEPFSAIIGVSAFLDQAGRKRTAKEDDLFLAVVRAGNLGVADFQTEEEGGEKHIVPLAGIIRHLKLTHPKLQLEVARGKEDYLCMLYGAFRGRSSVNRIEARNAAKAISKFMVYKPIKSLDEFVRNDILDPYDLSDAIRQVSNMMQNISSMEKEAGNISSGIDRLKQADKGIRAFIQTATDEQLAQYEYLDRKAASLQEAFLEAQVLEQKNTREKEQLEVEETDIKTTLDTLYERLHTLEIQSQGIDVLVRKRQLEEEISRLEKELRQEVVSFLNVNTIRSRNRTCAVKLQQALNRECGYLKENEAAAWETLLTRVLTADTWDDISFEEIASHQHVSQLLDIAEDARAIDQAHNTLVETLRKEADTLGESFFQAQNSVRTILEKVKRLKREIVQLENANEISYPPNTTRALNMINNLYPEADARVLCDHVEITDKNWQMAIEGLLGDNRFLILVNQAYETRAIELIEQNGLHKSAIVQGKKAALDAEQFGLPQTSIIHLMQFTHHLAECYLKAGYGNVRQVDAVETLRMTGRGLMQNGMASAGYKMFVKSIAESDLVFGAEARKRALEAKRDQLKDLEKQNESIQSQFLFFKTWYDGIKEVAVIDLSEPLSRLRRVDSAKSAALNQLQDLDLSEYEELEKKIRKTREDIDRHSDRKNKVIEKIGFLKSEIKTISGRKNFLSDERDKKIAESKKNEAILVAFASNWTALDVDVELEKIRQHRKSVTPMRKGENTNFGGHLNNHVKAVELSLEEFNRIKIRGRTIDYSQFSRQNLSREESPDDRISCFAFACDLYRKIDTAHNFLRNDILASHKDKLREMTKRFNTTFVSHICHTLHNAIREGKTKLDYLNRKLRNHVFGEEYYRFEYEWIPEYRDYVRFFKESMLINTDTDSSLFSGGHFSEENQRIFDDIIEKLLDENIDRSLRDLKRIADYRNYRSYDIMKCLPDRELSLKNYGTGSGGQMETPSYVIRSAGLSSALHFDEGHSHLRLVMIDESFSKMDEHRCRAVLDYLSTKLGLQIIFVVPNKSAGVLHDCVDQIFHVAKLRTEKARGELNTCVMINTNVLKKENVSELWNRERIAIANKARQLDFLDLLNKKKEDDPIATAE